MNKKRIFILIIICLILLMALLIALTVFQTSSEEDPTAGHIDGSEMEGLLTFSGMGVFAEKYTGEFETKEITAKIQELVKEDIPELYENIKKLDENKLKKYYNDNEKSIKDKFGIQSEEEFINFSNTIGKTKIKLNTLQKVKINKDSFLSQSDKANYAYVEFEVIFKDEEKMTFSMYVANRKIMSPQFIFRAK